MIMVTLMPLLRIASSTTTWTNATGANVYGKNFKLSTVWNAGTFASVTPCASSCAANHTCMSYTWFGGEGPQGGCPKVHECWQRSDTAWHPKSGRKCAAVSGYRGTPPGPSPPGPGTLTRNLILTLPLTLILTLTLNPKPEPEP